MNRPDFSTCAYVLLGAVAMFAVTAAALADEQRGAVATGNSSARSHKTDREAARGSHKRKMRVRCDHGETLTKALRHAREYDTIRFHGTCYESVVIATDHLTLRGIGGAAIDGSQNPAEAVLLIDGARQFELVDISVQNGSDQGILATHQAQGVLKNVSATGNGTVGLSVDRSHVELEDVTLDNNSTGGMDAYTASTIVAKGVLSASNNGGDGLAVNGKVFFELRGARVSANGNAGSGVSIINESRLQIFSFPEAQGSSVTADNNGFAGIGILGSELGVVGSQYFGSGANVISANNNFVFGFFMPAGAILSPHATAKFIASGNAVGMLMEDGASALIIGGLDVSNNGAGISAHGAGTLTLVSVPPNPSSVDGNRIDLDLGFGTRLTSDGLAFTSISCDASVLARGASCP
ncbi:MAG: right-handed parallel beta-helix repeat-containing protein [Woeseia sp.]